jgi:hypothetical protein
MFHPKVNLACPHCQKPLRVRVDYLGQRIVCKSCQHAFRAELEDAAAGQATSPVAKLAPVPLKVPDQERMAELEAEVHQLRTELAKWDLLTMPVLPLQEPDQRVVALEQELLRQKADNARLQADLVSARPTVVDHQGLELAKRALEALRSERDLLAQKVEEKEIEHRQEVERLQSRLQESEKTLAELEETLVWQPVTRRR